MEYGVYVGCPLCPLYSLLDNKIPQQLKINVSYNLVPTEAGEREKGGGGLGEGELWGLRGLSSTVILLLHAHFCLVLVFIWYSTVSNGYVDIILLVCHGQCRDK